MAEKGLDAEAAEALFHAVQQKNAAEAKELAVLTGLHGGLETLERARRELPMSLPIAQALDALERLARSVEGPGVEISVDLAELGGFNYESGLVFAAFARGLARCDRARRPLRRGGRQLRPRAPGDRIHDGPAPARGTRARQRTARARSSRRVPTTRRCARRSRGCAAAGEVVVVDLPGHEESTHELGCDRRLEKKDGKWRVT